METKKSQPWFIECFNNILRGRDCFDDNLSEAPKHFRYNYENQIVLDLHEFCLENDFDVIEKYKRGFSSLELKELLYDMCINDDSITGNVSGSYWFSSWYADLAICHNLYLFQNALDEFGSEVYIEDLDSEKIDVYIRCYLLRDCISEYVDTLLDWYYEQD